MKGTLLLALIFCSLFLVANSALAKQECAGTIRCRVFISPTKLPPQGKVQSGTPWAVSVAYIFSIYGYSITPESIEGQHGSRLLRPNLHDVLYDAFNSNWDSTDGRAFTSRAEPITIKRDDNPFRRESGLHVQPSVVTALNADQPVLLQMAYSEKTLVLVSLDYEAHQFSDGSYYFSGGTVFDPTIGQTKIVSSEDFTDEVVWIPHVGETPQWETSISNGQVQTVRHDVSRDLANISTDFDSRINGLQIYHRPISSSGFLQDTTVLCYRRLEVANIVVITINLISESLQSNGLHALNQWVKMKSPAPPDSQLGDYITVATATELFRQVHSLLRKLTNTVNDLAIDVATRTSPEPGAQMQLSTGKLTVRSTRTNTGFRNLFRGTYDLKVTKSGYKPFVQVAVVDLVDYSPKVLVCRLVPVDNHVEESECHEEF